MEDFLAGAVNFGAGAKLQDTAGIGRDNDRGAGVRGVFHLVGEQIESRLGLGDVVDAGGSAAVVRPLHLHQLDTGDGANQFAWGFADLLAVEEMAGVLIGDAERQRVEGRHEAEVGEKFGDVACFFTKCACLLILRFLGGEQMLVSLEG